MTVRVAVVDPLPMFARGLTAAIADEGYLADAPDDPLSWAAEPGTPLLLLTLEGDRDWALLAEILRVRADALVVVILAGATPEACARAVTAGAVGVLPRDASSAAVRDVVRAAVAGRSLLPIEVVRTLAAQASRPAPARLVSDDEINWLRQLADGVTVSRLAKKVGYSERMMFRLLSDLYARLGVSNRTKALMRARDEGWL